MARKTLIQIRRGLESALGTLAAGELGYCTDSGKLFIGSGSSNMLLAAGQSTGDMLKASTTRITTARSIMPRLRIRFRGQGWTASLRSIRQLHIPMIICRRVR